MALNYKLALTNVSFDSTYENAIRFNSRTEQEGYFNLTTLFANAIEINFNIKSLLNTTVIFKPQGLLNSVMNYNYAIVQDNTPNSALKYYYYFITSANYNSAGQVVLDMELDIINTYYIDTTFSDCTILKAHLNRFVNSGTAGSVKFNSDKYSPLFEREDIKDISKRLGARTKISIHPDKTVDSSLNNWLDTNVKLWVYIYLNKKLYKFYNNETSTEMTDYLDFITRYVEEWGNNYYTNPYSVICYPLYTNLSQIFSSDDNEHNFSISSIGLGDFLTLNDGDSSVFQVKLSCYPPFMPKEYIENTDYSIQNGHLIFNLNSGVPMGGARFLCTSVVSRSGIFSVAAQLAYEKSDMSVLTTDINNEFTKASIIGSNKNSRFNPKLNGQDFKALRLTNGTHFFEYDLQKIGIKNITFKYSEAFTPDITRFYVRFNSEDDDNIYNTKTADNLTGLVAVVDNTIPYSVNQQDAYLANNKNFFLQRNVATGQQVGKALINVGMGALQQNTWATVGGVVGVIDSIFNRIQSNLTLDNMKNAPEMLNNANGNAMFLSMVLEMGIYAEIYTALPNELEIANDMMNMYGYNYNRIGNIKDCDNIRYYHNYIKAKLENITSTLNLSNSVRSKFKDIFNNGIRFWNVTDNMYKYDKENYERWLAE